MPHERSFAEFWDSWKAEGYNQHRAVQAIYQNTIDYDTPPSIANLPDRTVLQGFSWNNAISLYAYTSDPESSYAELNWWIYPSPDWHCGVSIDAWNNIDINPVPGWLGSCDVTVHVSDGIKFDDDTFIVRVVPVVGRVYLPLVVKGYEGSEAVVAPDFGPYPFESPLPVPGGGPDPFRSPLPTSVGP
ncbi:MAG TPA: hypothetical protein ENF52_04745 [Chloroflexi bacterium]|nr:hypothetical protein [Chloroflexota bacterium]